MATHVVGSLGHLKPRGCMSVTAWHISKMQMQGGMTSVPAAAEHSGLKRVIGNGLPTRRAADTLGHGELPGAGHPPGGTLCWGRRRAGRLW